MKKNNLLKSALFFLLLSTIIINAHAQTGLNFQGVARTSNNVILASQAITIKLSILQGSATGTADYTETRRVTTNAQGLFTAVIGDTGAISTLGNFTTINWKLTPKFLKIEMDPAAGTNFITMGTTQFQYVAYAQFAKSVDAENIVGIIPVTLGGTGVASLAGLKTELAIDNLNNTSDAAKPISTLTQTALDLKLNTADTSKYTKQTYSDSALLTKLSTTGNAATATTAGNITATTNTTLTSLSNLATVGTITSGVWSGTAVAVEKGGTGLTSAGTNGQVLTSTGSGTLTWTTPVFLPTVVIGTQQWMKENLDVLTYRNGDVIPQVTDATTWAGLTTGAWCYYSNDPLNGAIYGKLYNWYAVNDPRGLAPQGWHIPTDAEWTTLSTLLGGDVAAGGKMKTTGITRWTTPNTSATNESGYAGLPGGNRNNSGTFNVVGNFGFWWSSTEDGTLDARYRILYYNIGDVGSYVNGKRVGFSVRCLRD